MKTPETINGKTHEEIKKGLVCGFCYECPYDDDKLGTVEECARQVHDDALAYIQQLESRIAQADLERDAAVNALRENGFCCDCKYIDVPAEEEPCFLCRERSHAQPKNWEWRGVCEENHK